MVLCDNITIVDFIKLIEEKYSKEEELKQYSEDAKRGLFIWEQNLIFPYVTDKDRVLVLGSGAGREVFGLKKMGINSTGVELSLAQIKEARKIMSELRLHCNFVRGNALALPFRSSCFNAVFMFRQFIQHFPKRINRKKLLDEVARVLLPGGFLFLSINLNPFSLSPLRILNYFYRRFKRAKEKVRIEQDLQSDSSGNGRRSCIIHRIFLNLIGFFTFSTIDVYRFIIKFLHGENYKGNEPGDHMISQVSGALSSGKIWFHAYSYNEIIRELKECGFEILNIRDITELELNQIFPEIIRKGAVFLAISARRTQ